MTAQQQPEVEFEHEDFDFATLEEEQRVNERCQSLLNSFYHYLLSRGKDPQEASDWAYCADCYVRDYVLDFARENVVQPAPGIVTRFAATWWITRTLDPDMAVLERYLTAIREFYLFLQSQHFISREELSWIEAETAKTDYYRQRIERFLAIKDDEYIGWEAECPLSD